jgi:TRAP-type C4-dicarboxylate transport system substrate-binding protein
MRKRFLGAVMIGLFMMLAVPAAVLAKPIVLNFAMMNPSTAYSSQHCLEPWAKAVEKATHGKVKIRIFYNQTLAKGKDSWNAIKLGVADMGWNAQGFWAGLTPLADVISLPALPLKTGEQASEVLWKLYEKYPQIRKEFSAEKVLLLYASPPYYLITRNKPVRTIEDLRGMKIRMFGELPCDEMKALGGVPVLIPMPDTYLALQKGVVDGMGAGWEPIYGFRLYEVAKYYTDAPFTAVYFSVTMNNTKWNSLPAKIQKEIMSVSGLKGAKFWGKHFWDIEKAATIAKAKEDGHPIHLIKLSKKERQRWLEVGGKPIWREWINKMEKKGHPQAKQILQTALKLSQE